MARTISFAPGEWYHCYSRGVDKRVIFMHPDEYERFQMYLYAANSTHPIHVSKLGNSSAGPTLDTVFQQERIERFVDIGAYALMPNHYHLLLRERYSGGISSFMQALNTGYTMYFNIRHERTGALLSGKFKASHVDMPEYLRRIAHYIHGNPAEMKEKYWKEGLIKNESALRQFIENYPYSSLREYCRPAEARGIVDQPSLLEMLEDRPSAALVIQDAKDFSQEQKFEIPL